jgi:hypothetical protein
LNFLVTFFKNAQILNFIKIRPVEADSFYEDVQTHRQTDRRDEANSRFSQFCEREAMKEVMYLGATVQSTGGWTNHKSRQMAKSIQYFVAIDMFLARVSDMKMVILENVREVSRESRLMRGAEIRGLKGVRCKKIGGRGQGTVQILRKLLKICFKLFSDINCRKDLLIHNVQHFRHSNL